jgi:cellobiose-specific phosphotransferase system component IIB
MELLYFISGILSVGVVYGIKLLRTVKSSHTDLLERYQSQSNISSIRNADLDDQLDSLKLLIGDIQANMEKDQYESLGNINKRIKELDTVVYGNVDKIKQSNQVFNKNVTDAFNEIQQLKRGLKALGQDPNMLSRY